jgi:hypothetical protein
MSAAIPALAPAYQRPRLDNVTEIIQEQTRAIRDRLYVPVGYLMRIQLGGCDDSAYFQDPVNAQIAPLTRIQGLTFEWDQLCYPHVTEMHSRGSGVFLFPDGVRELPKITDPRTRRLSPTDPVAPKIRQELDYFASGLLIGRDGTEFYVLQPVEQLAVRIPTTFAIVNGHADRGKKVALLFSKKKSHGMHTAFLVHGSLRFL